MGDYSNASAYGNFTWVVDRLLHPSGKLLKPVDAHHAPHPENLRWHRENIFGQALLDEQAPWA